MIILFDIGNTNTHVGLGDSRRVFEVADIPTAGWFGGSAPRFLRGALERGPLEGAALCSVVPRATPLVRRALKRLGPIPCWELTSKSLRGVGIDYPRPETIGADRLANALAARRRFGAPAVVVDFGTAVTFDVVDGAGNYVGGIIAPGLAAMTDYLHEKTALLPRIRIHQLKSTSAIGKSTEQAMLIGAVHGYRGLIAALVKELKGELKARRLPVVATGGYARLLAANLPEISAVDPLLTLEGLRLAWQERGDSIIHHPGHERTRSHR
ncbi:Type III pantothenate kinase [Verrucomicrobia bacterium]|nr:Type III pantothenate kinase [Verrucomicrobiota bacterium]